VSLQVLAGLHLPDEELLFSVRLVLNCASLDTLEMPQALWVPYGSRH
jgi:hypothetical protein